MEGNHPPARKACDLCYRRKIKCDGQQPRCSTCVVYKADCTYKAASRKAPSRKQVAIQRQLRERDLQARVDSLEEQLGSVLGRLQRLESRPNVSDPTTPSYSRHAPSVTGSTTQTFGYPELSLPPLQEVLPIAERYLDTFNSILPLFHRPTLLQTIHSWYQYPHLRDSVSWALINVVLGLAHHTSSLDCHTNSENTATFLNNAQSVLTDIIISETKLANIQVLLGLVILFWTAEDLGPALILVSTALRLAQKLGLHTRRSSEHLSPDVALQRNRVFWIAYILDRDISLNCRLAPVQRGSDIDLDLPPLKAENHDLSGFILAPDGGAQVNFLRARVDLATIQGKVYECVYSTTARQMNSTTRTESAAVIMQMLDDWCSRIPPEFRAASLSRACFPGISKYFCLLYATRLSCLALLSFASATDSAPYSQWMERLQDYGGRIAAGDTVTQAPVPPGWKTLANACREYMKLFDTVTRMDMFFTRMTLCAYNSSLICLTANSIFNFNDKAIEADKYIAFKAMKNLDDMVKQTGEPHMQQLRDILQPLLSHIDSMSCRSTLNLEAMPLELDFSQEIPQSAFDEPLDQYYLESLISMAAFDT